MFRNIVFLVMAFSLCHCVSQIKDLRTDNANPPEKAKPDSKDSAPKDPEPSVPNGNDIDTRPNVPSDNPVASLDIAKNLRSHVQELSVSIGRRNGLAQPESLKAAQNYVHKQLQSMGLDPKLLTYQARANTYANIEVVIPGPSSLQPLVVGAHYDSAESTAGADDNASGVAVLLELANILGGENKESKREIRLVAFTNEEPPFFRSPDMGSKRYLDYLTQNNISPVLMISLEMLGYVAKEHLQKLPDKALEGQFSKSGDYLVLVSNEPSASAANLLYQGLKEQQTAHFKIKDFTGPVSITGMDFSDHLNFWDANLNAVMITDTAFLRNPNYHTANDRPETLNFEAMADCVKALVAALKNYR